MLKDIVARKNVQDVPLLESVIKFLFNNIGNIVSSTNDEGIKQINAMDFLLEE